MNQLSDSTTQPIMAVAPSQASSIMSLNEVCSKKLSPSVHSPYSKFTSFLINPICYNSYNPDALFLILIK